MAIELKLAASHNSSLALVIGGDIESSFIPSDSAVVGFYADAASVSSAAFPNALIEAQSGSIGLSPAYPTISIDWTGVSPVISIEFRAAYPEVENHAPVTIDSATGYVIFTSSGFRRLIDQRIFPPEELFPGYSSDGTSIIIPIAALPGLSVSEADAVTGSWLDIMQSIMLRADDALNEAHPINSMAQNRPQTISSFILEDWNRPTVNQMRRDIRIKFNIKYAAQKITEEPT